MLLNLIVDLENIKYQKLLSKMFDHNSWYCFYFQLGVYIVPSIWKPSHAQFEKVSQNRLFFAFHFPYFAHYASIFTDESVLPNLRPTPSEDGVNFL